MPMLSDLRDGEDGFTLVELLVVMTLSTIILLATFYSLDQFSSTAAQQTELTDANGQVRDQMDSAVRDLRGASGILKATAADLVYMVPESGGTRVQRLCVDTGELYGWSAVTASPAVPAAACSSGTLVATLKSTANTAFSYDGAASVATGALSTIKNVGITLSLDATKGGKAGSSTLKASAARRSSGTLPITQADLPVKCNPDGTAFLSLGASLADYGPLTVTYADTGGVAIGTPGGGGVTIPTAITTVVATVTDALGVTNTISKDIQCTP